MNGICRSGSRTNAGRDIRHRPTGSQKQKTEAIQSNKMFVFEKASGKTFVLEISECHYGIRPFRVATQTGEQHCLCELVCAQYFVGKKPSNHAVKRSHQTESYTQDCQLDWQRRPRISQPGRPSGPRMLKVHNYHPRQREDRKNYTIFTCDRSALGASQRSETSTTSKHRAATHNGKQCVQTQVCPSWNIPLCLCAFPQS